MNVACRAIALTVAVMWPASLSALTLQSLPVSSSDTSASPRVRYTINDGWTYVHGDQAGAEAVRHDDRAWAAVSLPHTWNSEDAFTKVIGYRRGVGWYRKQLTLDESLRGKRLFLFFEGANQVADVFVNGRPAGRHTGGYTAFAFDITELARLDSVNVIAVRVDNSHDDDIPPLNADFTFYGGIYRDVWLVATSSVHITLLDHASPGVFIDTPGISREHATVRVRGTVVNHDPHVKNVDVVNRVMNASGGEVVRMRSRLRVPAAGSAVFDQRSARVMRPLLWSPEEPNLYRVVTEIHDENVLTDRTSNPLGFRWFKVDPKRGFLLNGQRYPLYGTNRHQDREVLGNALPNGAHKQDVELVKATGFNFLRLAHYPQDPVVLDEMDRQGLVGWEEIPVVNIISLSSAFADNAERMLVEMIRQHYNHPSIVFWGYMNEVLLRKPTPMPEGYVSRVLALTKRLEARVKKEDATRVTVTAVSLDEVDDGSGVQDVPDVLGLNLYFGWYYRTLEGLGPYLDSLRARHPGRPLLISEYGADSDERIHAMKPAAFDFSNEHQQRFHESNFRQMRAREYLVGTAVWNQFDFGSKGRHDSKPNLNQKGLFYFDRTPKDVWQYYRATLRREPILHIATRDWLVRAGSSAEDSKQPIVVYSNLPRVELFANGMSLGTQSIENAHATWMVPFRAGSNRLEARGGNGVVDVVEVSYDDRSTLFAARGSTARGIAVNAGSHYQYVDASGTVWEADRPYKAGEWGYVGGETRLRHHRIYGTGEDALYQIERTGAEQYRFDVPDGEYEVRLLFAEQEFDRAGQRVFDVDVNGLYVFRKLDLAGTRGRYSAVERSIVVNAANGAGIIVRLSAITGKTTISGVMLRMR